MLYAKYLLQYCEQAGLGEHVVLSQEQDGGSDRDRGDGYVCSLLVDGEDLTKYLYEQSGLDWTCGGQYRQYVTRYFLRRAIFFFVCLVFVS